MKVNNINFNNTNCNGRKKQSPAFKSVGFLLTPPSKGGIPINMRPLIVFINQSEPDFVWYHGQSGHIAPLGFSEFAEKISGMFNKLGKKIIEDENKPEVKKLLKQLNEQLKEDNNMQGTIIFDDTRFKEIDSIIDEGTFVVGENELALAKDKQALDFLIKK